MRWIPNERISFPQTSPTTAAVGQETAWVAKVWHHMPEENFAHHVYGVVAGRYKDSVSGVAIHKHDEEFLSVVGGERSYNVHGERVPWTPGLYGPRRLLTVAIIAPHLTLWATLSYL